MPRKYTYRRVTSTHTWKEIYELCGSVAPAFLNEKWGKLKIKELPSGEAVVSHPGMNARNPVRLTADEYLKSWPIYHPRVRSLEVSM